jgi:hypothetical protein
METTEVSERDKSEGGAGEKSINSPVFTITNQTRKGNAYMTSSDVATVVKRTTSHDLLDTYEYNGWHTWFCECGEDGEPMHTVEGAELSHKAHAMNSDRIKR